VEVPLAWFHLFPVSAQHDVMVARQPSLNAQHDVIISCSTATLHSMMSLLLGNQAV